MTNCLKKRAALILSAAALCLQLALTPAAQAAESPPPEAEEPAAVVTVETTEAYGKVSTVRTTVFGDGDVFRVEKIERKAGTDAELIAYETVKGRTGTVRYYDAGAGAWKTVPLSNGYLPIAVLFIETPEESLILSPGHMYRDMGSASLERVAAAEQRISVSNRNGSFSFCFRFRKSGEAFGLVWSLRSAETLVEWGPEAEALWTRLNFAGAHRIGFDGAYYTTPRDYGPYSPAMIWRNPAVFPTGVLVESDGRAAEKLCRVLLDRAIENQEESGLWPTVPASTWLRTDYGIAPGFYDTRFNCDVTMSLFAAGERYSDPRYTAAALKAADYLAAHAGKNRIAVSGGGRSGILVADYAHPSEPHALTHASLNHHLQEIKVLLTASERGGEKAESYMALAMRMLDGVKATASKWIMPNGNLYYAMRPDGTMRDGDYPALTYNDLYETQAMLERLAGARDSDLQALMDSKKTYMDKNGITEYLGYAPPAA